ncbi:E3 ubiquitin-protein ligase HW1 [Chamberlinius hualienensis]
MGFIQFIKQLIYFDEEVFAPPSSHNITDEHCNIKINKDESFELKLQMLERKLKARGFSQSSRKLKLNLRRNYVIEDAFSTIMFLSPKKLQRNKLSVKFEGELGLDYGGPSREFFSLISAIFNPMYGLFELTNHNQLRISPVSSLYVDNYHRLYRFCGRIIGLALIHQQTLPEVVLAETLYKVMLNIELTTDDLQTVDKELHQSLRWLLENDISKDEQLKQLTFTVNQHIFGQRATEIELMEKGKDVQLNESNKVKYVKQLAKWKLIDNVQQQTTCFFKGFAEVVDVELLKATLSLPAELQLALNGRKAINANEWQLNTEYKSGYHPDHPVIKWFWSIINQMDIQRQLRLIQFVSGSCGIPYKGFKFCIEKYGDDNNLLPRAVTCFNQLQLPAYTSYSVLKHKLQLAIDESNSFDFN